MTSPPMPSHPHALLYVALLAVLVVLYQGSKFWIFTADVMHAMAVVALPFLAWRFWRRFHEPTISKQEEQ